VVYKRLDQIQSLTVETVIVAVGWEGNSDNLGLEAAGIQIERSYITVNDHLQTTKPHIYAAGDITGRVMLVQTGSYEGQVAAENAILGPARRHRHKIVPHGGFTDPEYGSVGLTEAQAQTVEDGCAVAVVPYADLDRAVIDGRTEGFCKLIVSRQNHRLLGAHVVGEQALEVVQLVAGGMASDMWVEQLAELELAYPTYTAILGLAARQLIRELGVTPLTPQWRALGKERASEWERKAK
jgi:dihydrolipoamide dehydrogenase